MVMECSREAAAESTMPKKYTTKEVRRVIQKANTKKSPGYDLITNKILKELPNSGESHRQRAGALLYLIYTSDLPTSDCITTGTFADDTAILASHQDPAEASKSYRMALTIF
ncbi:hypothetical protein EVAR_80258_1 [Eumeta japonica]|uniref:Uncharacterized protein n=1 Tax=Eumeta variegata TaxID=151549 RepID=A0A4C1UB59_EUMVA|nr:hypothetical protein EVAR_80258_1 [Eumeta japonica]